MTKLSLNICELKRKCKRLPRQEEQYVKKSTDSKDDISRMGKYDDIFY